MTKSEISLILATGLLVTLTSCSPDDESEASNSGVHKLGKFECEELDSETLNPLFGIDDDWEIVYEDTKEDLWNNSSEEGENESSGIHSSQTCWYRTDPNFSEPELHFYISFYPDEEQAQIGFEHFLDKSDPNGSHMIDEVFDHGFEWERVGLEEANEEGFHAQFLDSNLRIRATMGEEYPADATNEIRLEILSELARKVADL